MSRKLNILAYNSVKNGSFISNRFCVDRLSVAHDAFYRLSQVKDRNILTLKMSIKVADFIPN